MVNIFIGNKNKQIGFKVSGDSKKVIEERAASLNLSITDYILVLIDKDLKDIKEERRC